MRAPRRGRAPLGVAAATVALGLFLSSCADQAPEEGSDQRTPSPDLELGPFEDVPSAIDDPAADTLPEPLIDVDRLISGGPPPDGIPALVDPVYEDAADVDWLESPEPVLAVSLNGDHRAFPVRIMVWHEIVNDTIGDVPAAVTYCPLCDSALAFDRRVGGADGGDEPERVLDLGVSGLLYNSDLVMFDRQTHSLWPQIEGRAVAGTLTGTELERISVTVMDWERWHDAHPDGRVLSQDTGHDRNYGLTPYTGYDDPESDPFLFDEDTDARMPAKTRVVGLGADDTAIAIPVQETAERDVVEVDVGGTPVTVWIEPGVASALDSAQIAEGREVSATGAFRPEADGRNLTFEAVDDGFTDQQTGSTWNILGEAVEGPLAGQRLPAVDHVDTFWFAWVAFSPDTEINTR
ncbi:DUF3179 domain-containing protein [Nocardiopsis rhodophaea]|uniref:DUF3179 domain-containing protein n=1 Tax=Nocardiopsis rhodophaea TaxID=280238 RepID=UPI0031DE0FF6